MNGCTELTGTVEKITFYNSTNGFAVIELNTGDELTTAVGTMFDVRAGEEVRLFGRFDVHATFGPQFKVEQMEHCAPSSLAAMLRYLSGGGIKGIGPALARRIVERFGVKSLEIIEADPLRLTEIRGISKEKALGFQKEYLKQIGVRELVVYLSQYDIPADEALKIYRVLGPASLDTVKSNPYALCCEELPFAFEQVDEMASNMGFERDFRFRIFCGIEYVLRHNLSNGHVCLPRDKLEPLAAQLLGAETDDVHGAVSEMLGAGRLSVYESGTREFLYLPDYYQAESYAAQRIQMILSSRPLVVPDMEKKIAAVEKEMAVRFESKQLEAIHAVADAGLLILTGGPGTGKTTTLNAVIRVFESAGLKALLAAPTGRAAKRMSEVTGCEAKTVHRLLEAEFDANGRSVFCRNQHKPIECDLLIVDEVSMIDSLLFAHLLQALPLGCRLILVGDADQLPSVGAGNVLHDMIDSGCVPTVALKTIFRQSMRSAIVTNAHKINAGEMPDLDVRDSDFFFLNCEDPNAVSDKVLELVTERLPHAYGYSPVADIQVLAPSRKREAGTAALNNRMQAALNPKSRDRHEMVFPSFVLREGDKVMQIRNNYDIEWDRDDGTGGVGVFNGDVGMLEKVDLSLGIFTVRFDDRVAVYPVEFADQLDLAYAVTVHKSQGSEYPCVVLPVSDMPAPLRYRNLLYTAVTRARSLLVVVGSRRVLASMVENDRRVRRYTRMGEMVKELCL